MRFHVGSAAGELKQPIVHQPGIEPGRLTPDNVDELVARAPVSGFQRQGIRVQSRRRRLRRHAVPLFLTWVVVLTALLSASPVWADEPGETDVGYLLVQQALGHLAHDTNDTGIDLALEKVDDALNTKDQEGVDVAELRQARAALEAGDVPQGRAQLTESISAALSQLPPATGEGTGTTTVPSALPGRGTLSGSDWMLLVVSVLLLGLGGGLAWHFRPRDNLRRLRAQLGSGSAPATPPTGPEGS